ADRWSADGPLPGVGRPSVGRAAPVAEALPRRPRRRAWARAPPGSGIPAAAGLAELLAPVAVRPGAARAAAGGLPVARPSPAGRHDPEPLLHPAHRALGPARGRGRAPAVGCRGGCLCASPKPRQLWVDRIPPGPRTVAASAGLYGAHAEACSLR